MCLGALRGEHSLKVARSARAVRAQCKDSPFVGFASFIACANMGVNLKFSSSHGLLVFACTWKCGRRSRCTHTMCMPTCVPVVVCVARKLRPCPNYSGCRDRNNSVHWGSLYKGGGVPLASVGNVPTRWNYPCHPDALILLSPPRPFLPGLVRYTVGNPNQTQQQKTYGNRYTSLLRHMAPTQTHPPQNRRPPFWLHAG